MSAFFRNTQYMGIDVGGLNDRCCHIAGEHGRVLC